ncbi:hypothetical protein SLEP1_g18152 [Rubroshorea leprosula]|uniref:Uncharacterized protein n=1 Tax=Rubroshorea leprosula TaxID=152421 RepID=A0AAV5J5I3_9ROSI|nr:hypothetical protein SLEP1_g18152 [Rubroshorea leprosula]
MCDLISKMTNRSNDKGTDLLLSCHLGDAVRCKKDSPL